MDYISGPYIIIIPAGVTNVSFDVKIINDNLLEIDENFVLDIDSFSPSIDITIGVPHQTVITILDDDGKQENKINTHLCV